MTVIPTTTIDLLLKLGISITDVLTKRISPKERQEIQSLAETTKTYQHVREFLASYRHAWDQALGGGKLDDLYSLCTQAGYAQQLELIQRYNALQIIQSFVHAADLLDIRLISEVRTQTSATGLVSTSLTGAEAYMYSIQTQRYRNGPDIRVSSLQVCRLLNIEKALETKCTRAVMRANLSIGTTGDYLVLTPTTPLVCRAFFPRRAARWARTNACAGPLPVSTYRRNSDASSSRTGHRLPTMCYAPAARPPTA
jgi:hypothetical protein